MTDNTPTPLTPEDKPGLEEMAESLTGYEELGIEKAFGKEATDLSGTRIARACAFVLFKRRGQTHDEAYASAMGLTLKEVMGLFDTDEEVIPDEPVTTVGKDALQPTDALQSSLPSAS